MTPTLLEYLARFLPLDEIQFRCGGPRKFRELQEDPIFRTAYETGLKKKYGRGSGYPKTLRQRGFTDSEYRAMLRMSNPFAVVGTPQINGPPRSARPPSLKTFIRELYATSPAPALTVDEILEQYPSQVKRHSVTSAISDLRNPKYAGAKSLDIVRDSDGHYRLRV